MSYEKQFWEEESNSNADREIEQLEMLLKKAESKADSFHVEIASLQSEIDRLKEENLKLKESLKKLFGYMDSGFLIRDISKDHEPGWAMKMLPFQMDLKEAYDRIK